MIARSIRAGEDNACCYRKITGNRKRVIWEITNRCNLSCRHCFVNNKHRDLSLSTEKCIEIIDDFANFPVAKVMITGGEPFIRDDIFILLERIKRVDPEIIIDLTTNMTLLDDEKICRLKDIGIDELTTSIDGDMDTHDRIRSRGNFSRVISISRLALSMGISVDAVTVANNMNSHLIGDIIDTARDNGFSSITVSGIIVRNEQHQSVRGLTLADEDRQRLKDIILEKRERYGDSFPIRTVALLRRHAGDKCGISNLVSISHDGTVALCNLTSDRPARHYSVFTHRISDIHDRLQRTRCEMD
jgi:MoaA/NifB/PqqE/SkfB family radical SAM enzyme